MGDDMDRSSRGKQPVQNNLRYYRVKLGVTQQEMEWRTGLSKNNWHHYENGREPGIKLVQVFAKVFNQIAEEKDIAIKKLSSDDLYPP
ncbi:helix-turn-helix transcriptional regulator [Desulfosporosinus sp. PR]|uniref:helix-turn-helix domain-containing protein n=1 Tax=Candidatus Desulfosporosinus nitrosoreducens TaxID=3401928 RepID=UPI0027FCFDC0|nr:helix-turn-helix transcriptional regulator [Desulfosporosinus sp. PR]MDQ7094279.1 helix-turn-helix transcriptional regulator [Desulfosporosinus sp. PR]